MKIKTDSLTSPALDWVVCQIEGPQDLWGNDEIQFARLLCEINATQDKLDIAPLAAEMDLPPSRIAEIFERAHQKWELSKRQSAGHAINAEQLQAIIDHWAITLCPDEYLTGEKRWCAGCTNEGEVYEAFGPTSSIAAMRCYAASKLGPEVEVPDELVPHLVAQRAAAQEAAAQNHPANRPRG